MLSDNIKRPIGVTIIAILSLIGGIIFIFSGSIIFGIFGIVSIIVFYGLIRGRAWAWTLTIVFSIINMVSQIILLMLASLNIFAETNSLSDEFVKTVISTIINLVIIYYLYRDNVKAFFGKTVKFN